MPSSRNNETIRVSDIGEVELIRRITPLLYQPSEKITLGVGDDAAVLSKIEGNPVITVDTMCEGVHFDLAYASAQDVGHRLLAANLSDMAAMGANPTAAVVSLALPGITRVSLVEGLYGGFRPLCEEHDVALVGGDVVGSGNGITVTLTLIGEAGDNVLMRSGCRPGDTLLITGEIGLSEAGLQNLTGRIELPDELSDKADARHLRPTPRLREGIALADMELATGCIDTSDSLAISLHHLSEMSGAGFVVDVDAIPVSTALVEAEKQLVEAGHHPEYGPVGYALYAGEDFELLFTCAPVNVGRITGLFSAMETTVTVIGEVVAIERGIKLRRDGEENEITASGFAHF
ncbi:MAG: thiamine-phosphate kinase [bacterium]|nr:thiamine-phosphate kinase [bacterium]